MWTEIETRTEHARSAAASRGLRVMDALHRFQLAEAGLRSRSARLMGVTETEILALRFVVRRNEHGQSVTPTDLATYLGVRSTAVTLVVDHLESAGHLVRQPHPSDRRSLVLVATDAAASRVREMFGPVYDTMMTVAGQLADTDADRVEGFLSALAATLDSFAPERPSG